MAEEGGEATTARRPTILLKYMCGVMVFKVGSRKIVTKV